MYDPNRVEGNYLTFKLFVQDEVAVILREQLREQSAAYEARMQQQEEKLMSLMGQVRELQTRVRILETQTHVEPQVRYTPRETSKI